MKTAVETIVLLSMLGALYFNWTDFPKPLHLTVSGPLIKIGVEK
jgi:hypothetical protein